MGGRRRMESGPRTEKAEGFRAMATWVAQLPFEANSRHSEREICRSNPRTPCGVRFRRRSYVSRVLTPGSCFSAVRTRFLRTRPGAGSTSSDDATQKCKTNLIPRTGNWSAARFMPLFSRYFSILGLKVLFRKTNLIPRTDTPLSPASTPLTSVRQDVPFGFCLENPQ